MFEHVALRAGRASPPRPARLLRARALLFLTSLSVAQLCACDHPRPEADAPPNAAPDTGVVQGGKMDAAAGAPDAGVIGTQTPMDSALEPTPALDAARPDAAPPSDASALDASRAPDAAPADAASVVDGGHCLR